MKIAAKQLIDDLTVRTQAHIEAVKEFENLNDEALNWKVQPESWSILECLEHLNLYGDFYLPEIERSIQTQGTPKPGAVFKSGFLGNYFAKSMLPQEKLNKMKTFKDKDPVGSKLSRQVLSRFLGQQESMLRLLKKAEKTDLSKVKTSISISRLIKLRLGDTFRVVVYHNERHIAQANKVLAQMELPVQGFPST